MSLTPVTTYKESKAAFTALGKILRQNTKPINTTIGWPGGSVPATVRWNDQFGFWSYIYEEDSKYWCAYGVRHPIVAKNTNITCWRKARFRNRTPESYSEISGRRTKISKIFLRPCASGVTIVRRTGRRECRRSRYRCRLAGLQRRYQRREIRIGAGGARPSRLVYDRG